MADKLTPATDAAREARARKVLAKHLEADGYLALAKSARFGAGMDSSLRAMLAFADTEAASQPREGDGHTDNMAVDRFAAQMKAKLAAARAKGRGGWDDPAQCSTDYLRQLLHEHIAKGDPVDVANFCMMLAHYGASTALTQRPPEQAGAVPAGDSAALVRELRPLIDAAAGPNGWDWTFPIRVQPVDGKPTIVANKGGNLFRGFIATWDEAHLFAALANAVPRIMAALSAAPTPRDAGPEEILHIAREAAASVFDADEQHCIAADIRAARQDHMSQVQAAIAALTLKASAETPPDAGIGSDGAGERECPSSPDGRHQVDTSMESGPNNCFHCEASMRATQPGDGGRS